MMNTSWKANMWAGTLGILVTVAAAQPPASSQPTPHEGDPYLQGRTLAESEADLAKSLEQTPGDDPVRYRLGAVRMVRAVERLAQSLYRHGAGSSQSLRPFVQPPFLNVPVNPNPVEIDYPTLRSIVQTWVSDLTVAEKTLAEIKDPNVALAVYLGQIRVDVDGDGKTTDAEALGALSPSFFGQRNIGPDEVLDWYIRFDRTDVNWMRAYCHFVMALSEMLLAYDGQQMFDCTAHLLFDKVKSPYPFLDGRSGPEMVNYYGHFLDMIAGVHLVRWPVQEPEKMKSALGHLESMISLSRDLWPLANAETDNDHEWIPNPNQTSVMPNSPMTVELIQGWLAFLDEAQALLEGKKLIPFWRGEKPLGVNLRRVFLEPTPFDLILWVQGSAAAPYLEQGTLTTEETWENLQRVFQGQFVGYAFWIN